MMRELTEAKYCRFFKIQKPLDEDMECEKCKAKPEGYNLFDYCADCLETLCPKCMKDGCCGEVPAVSGMERDHAEPEIRGI